MTLCYLSSTITHQLTCILRAVLQLTFLNSDLALTDGSCDVSSDPISVRLDDPLQNPNPRFVLDLVPTFRCRLNNNAFQTIASAQQKEACEDVFGGVCAFKGAPVDLSPLRLQEVDICEIVGSGYSPATAAGAQELEEAVAAGAVLTNGTVPGGYLDDDCAFVLTANCPCLVGNEAEFVSRCPNPFPAMTLRQLRKSSTTTHLVCFCVLTCCRIVV